MTVLPLWLLLALVFTGALGLLVFAATILHAVITAVLASSPRTQGATKPDTDVGILPTVPAPLAPLSEGAGTGHLRFTIVSATPLACRDQYPLSLATELDAVVVRLDDFRARRGLDGAA